MVGEIHAVTYAASAVAGVLMVQAGTLKRMVVSRERTRWCAACHRRVTGGRCGCSERH